MSKIRQRRFPDGSVTVRTHPLTMLSDRVEPPHAHEWHQLTYALRGQLEVDTADARALIPPDCALWVPAGVVHREMMRAPVTVRTLYVAPGALPPQPPRCRTVGVSPLLRELIVHVSRLGALDRREPAQRRLAAVLVDLLAALPDVPLSLPTPRDPRARRVAALIEAAPGDDAPLAALARRAGGSLRTLERRFVEDTGLGLGEWRRRFRLFHALRLLEEGAPVTRVAFDVGYASASAFTAAFARHFGAPPTRRRRGRAALD
jgi:AraC-like DNA-binding protein